MHLALALTLCASLLLAAAGCNDRPPATGSPAAPGTAPAQPHDEPAPAGADPKQHGATTVPAPEPDTHDDSAQPPPLSARDSLCVRSCIEQNQMVAMAPEAIEMDCVRGCQGCVDACAGTDPSAQQRQACDERCAGGDAHGGPGGAP